MSNKNQLDRGSEDYSHLFSQYMKRGARSMTDTEIRALSETSGGTVLFPTIYANKFNEMLGDDTVYSQVSKMIVNSSTVSVPIITSARTPVGGFNVQNNPGEAGTLIDATTAATQVTVPTIALPGTSTSGTSTATLALKRISVMVKVSNELLEDSAGQGDASVESWIVRQAAQDIGKEINRQIMLGNASGTVTAGTGTTAGSDSCHGLASTLKRYSTRSMTTTTLIGSTNGNFTAANGLGLVSLMSLNSMDFLQAAYWNRCSFILNSQVNRNFLANTMTVASWSNPMFVAESKIFARPLIWAELSGASRAGLTPDTGEFIAILCDLSRYTFFSTTEGVQVTRLVETFGETNQTAFVVSMRCAGVLTDINAAYGVYRG
jgi:HK97 family phage major capsid protein